jgi:outer membrane protein assembly factor BamB
MKNARRSILAIAAAITLGSATAAFADDWPQWRGPTRDGKVSGFTPPATWPKQLAQKWKITVGDGVATPALVGDRLYVFTRQGTDEVLTCVNAANGEEIWKKAYPATVVVSGPAGSFPGPRSSPAVADGKVVTLGVGGILTCWDAKDGKMLWKKTEPKGFPGFYVSSSPAIVDGLAIAQLGGRGAGMGGGGGRRGGPGGGPGGAGPGNPPSIQQQAGGGGGGQAGGGGGGAAPAGGGIIAFDLSSGNERWKWMGESPAYASPIVATIADVKQIIAPGERSLVGISATDGKLLWQISLQGGRYNAPTPVVDGDTVYLTGLGGNGTRAVKITREGETFSTKEAWNNPDVGATFASPILKDGFLYGLSGQGSLFCINAKDGTTAWTGPQMGGGGGRGPGGGGFGGGGGRGPGGGGAGGGGGGAQGGGAGGQVGGGGGQAGGAQAAERQGGGGGGQVGGQGAGGGPGGRPGGGRPGGGGGRGGGANFGAIVDAGELLIALPSNSELIAFKPNGKAYEEVGRIKVSESATHAHPILTGNKVYVKDQQSLSLLAFE